MVRYSLETRREVFAAIESGNSVRKVASQFGVSESFVRRVIRRMSETGSVAPLPRTNAGRKPKLTPDDLDFLRRSVIDHPLRTLREHRDELGVQCSISVIHAAIKKLGLQYVREAALDVGAVGVEQHASSNGHAPCPHPPETEKIERANGTNGKATRLAAANQADESVMVPSELESQ